MVTSNQLIELYNKYASVLSTQISDNIAAEINENVSGKLDSCKQLILIGTNTPPVSGQAQLNTQYYRLTVPNTATETSLLTLFNSSSPSALTLSSHFSSLAENTNEGSDVIKLSFAEPVPTSARVLEMLDEANKSAIKMLEIHNGWTENTVVDETYPDWLKRQPHKQLFQNVSAYIKTSLDNHDSSIYAHDNRFANYYTKPDIDSLNANLKAYLETEIARATGREGDLEQYTDDEISKLAKTISNHINATNKNVNNTADWAHKNIFDQYYTKSQVENKDDTIYQKASSDLTTHKNNGHIDHTTLAPKLNPSLSGNLYLNYYKTSLNNEDYSDSFYFKVSPSVYGILGQSSKTTPGITLTAVGPGCEPILIQQKQTNSSNKVNTVYILNEDGDTSFPNNVTVTKNLTVKDIISSGDYTSETGTINVKTLNTTARSTTQLNNLPITDSSNIIPNTAWVQSMFNGKSVTLASVLSEINNDDVYYCIFPEDTKPTNLDTVQRFGFTKNITYNPQLGKITAKIVSAPTLSGNATSANTAKNADKATYATSAGTATSATTAETATKAITADTATKATTADKATNADYATKAGTATTADTATKANTANTATSATTADKATKADSATKATTADKATKADSATKADKATSADYATKAGTANSATTANKAEFDTAGNALNTMVQPSSGTGSYYILGTSSSSKSVPHYVTGITMNGSDSSITAKTFKGVATSAQWADIAEIYATDKKYPAGTLVQFGGSKELTQAVTAVNGVISENPAYLMNSKMEGQPIAVAGRVKVLINGPITKFDLIKLDLQHPGYACKAVKTDTNLLGRCLETNLDQNIKLVLCTVQMSIFNE